MKIKTTLLEAKARDERDRKGPQIAPIRLHEVDGQAVGSLACGKAIGHQQIGHQTDLLPGR